MSKNTSIVTIFSGFIGGSTKAAHKVVVEHTEIDFVKIIIAAAISAAVGYLVKLLFDEIKESLKKRMKR